MLQARKSLELLLGMEDGSLCGKLDIPITSKQTLHSNLCGYYALAYALSLAEYAYAQPPQHVTSAIYDESKMEDHLKEIMAEQGDECQPFPQKVLALSEPAGEKTDTASEVKSGAQEHEFAAAEKCDEETPLMVEENNDVVGKKPSDEMGGEKPSDEMGGEKPSDDMVGETPSDDMVAEKLSDAMVGEKLSDAMVMEKPSDMMVGEEPSDMMVMEKPSDMMVMEKPSDVMSD